MSGAGTLVEHLAMLSGLEMSGSSASERRQALPWAVFVKILDLALSPLAQAGKHRQAFYHGLRLVAIEGTQFSLVNTPQILKSCTKAATRRLKAAFAKLNAVVLLEVGLHNPLAAGIDPAKSEWALALELIGKLPAKSLLLADRLYGCARFVWGLLQHCEAVGSFFWSGLAYNSRARWSGDSPTAARSCASRCEPLLGEGRLSGILSCARSGSK